MTQTTKILSAVLIALLVLFGGAAGYFYFVYAQQPDMVVKRSLLAMSQVDSAAYTLHGQGMGMGHNLVLDMNGAMSSGEHGDAWSNFSLSADIKDEHYGPIEGETRSKDGVMYFNVHSVPLPDALSKEEDALNEALANRWVSADKAAVNDLMQGKNPMDQNTAPEEPAPQLNEEQMKQVQSATQELALNAITVTEELPDEMMDGVNNYHYRYDVSDEAVDTYTNRMHEIVGDQADKYMPFITHLKDTDGEVWIGKDDYLVRKITMQKPDAWNAEITMKDFDQPVEVTVPQEARSLKDVVADVQSAITTKMQSMDADKDGLSQRLELLFSTDPTQADSDGDGYPDGIEIQNGYNPRGEGTFSPYDDIRTLPSV